jgi:hypothetical protein
MNQQSVRNNCPIDGTKLDFYHSWTLLRQNYKAFLGTELFAIGASFVILSLGYILSWVFNPDSTSFFSNRFYLESSYRWVSLSIAYLVLNAFINCQTGLAYDIMSSGEMFAEFKSSFGYFVQHWWKYIFLSIFIGSMGMSFVFNPRFRDPNIPPTPSFPLPVLLGLVLVGILSFFWFAIFNQSLASVNAQGKLGRALIESIRIFRADPKRVLSTWGVFYLIFSVPGIIFEFVLRILTVSEFTSQIIILFFMLVYNLFIILIGLPLRALIVTGLYNNIPFKRFKPDLIENTK